MDTQELIDLRHHLGKFIEEEKNENWDNECNAYLKPCCQLFHCFEYWKKIHL
jgi:hypothetical protein